MWRTCDRCTGPQPLYMILKAKLEIQCDDSQTGLRVALLQRGRPLHIWAVLTETRRQYTQIEMELRPIMFLPRNSISRNMDGTWKFKATTICLNPFCRSLSCVEALWILKNIILYRWPELCNQVPSQIRSYFSIRDELTIQGGVIFCGQCIIVSVSLGHDKKQKLQASHLGAESCLQWACKTIFWLSMNAKVKDLIASCETCH